MELGLVMSFLAASVLLALMPGPDNIFVLTESLTKGQRNGVAISLGLSLGVLVHTTAAATGLSLIIQNSAFAFNIVKYLGAAYLFYLAYQAYHEKSTVIDLNVNSKLQEKTSIFSLVRKGFLMNVLNPKVSLFFIAFLPQFLTKDGLNVTLQMIILGIIFMVQAFVIFSCIALMAGRLTNFLNSSKFWKVTKWSKVIVLFVLGVSLGVSRSLR